MPTVNVKPDSGAELQKIAEALGKSRKVVVITGAGISTKCGIPDFRSEDGLYSLIQAQFDNSLKNPPWQQSNILDIDKRPKKKRKQWYYEVVAPDGQIVDVIDEDLPDPKSEELKLQSRSPSKSTNSTENFRSRSPTTKSCGESSLSRCRSIFSDPLEDYPSKGFATSNSSPGPPVSLSTHRSDTCISSQHCHLDCSSWSGPRANNRFSGANSLRQNTTKLEPTAATPSAIIEVIPLTCAQTISKQQPSPLLTISDDERPSKMRSSQPRALPNIKGRDLFDSMIWSDPFTTSIFYMFISSLRQKIKDVDSTTETHRFIRVLRDGGRLVRTYTQNIDCLEEREGLSTDLTLGPGNRARFHRRNQQERPPVSVAREMNHFRGVEVVLLHGSLDSLRCGLCSRLFNWDECDRSITTAAGAAPDCPYCTDYNSKRRGIGRRGLTVGRLRPDIVLYGEEHPNSSLISPLVTHDLRLGPDILLIMGTSLKVHGLKIMIKEFAKAVHMRGGKVVFVNWTRPSESTWGDVIDYWVEWDCDEWVLDLKKRSSHVWSPQSRIKIEKQRRESGRGTSLQRKKQRPVALQDENSNGAFIVSRILSNLAKELTDSKNTFKRRSFRSYSLQPIASTSEFKFSKGGTTRTGPRITKAKNRLRPKSVQEESHAEHDMKLVLSKDELNPPKDITFYVAGNWSKLGVEHDKENLILSSMLPITPLELRQVLGKLSSNLPKYQDHGSKTHMSVINWPLGKITLATHPPHISRVPVHTRQLSELRNASHSYGARAGNSSTQSSSEAIFVDEGVLPASDGSDTIILKGHAMPELQRIQNINRISKFMSNRENDAAEATCKPKI